MEIILDLLKGAVQGIMREVSAHLFRKTFLEQKNTTSTRRPKRKGGIHKQ